VLSSLKIKTLLIVMVVFVLSGCASEASALPNIEATVEAKITELTAPNTPVPAPTLIIIITEVIKEVEVPVIVEVEVIKEIEGPQVVVEKIVEVEVVVTATPGP
tara:strand:- start:134 stop:445 length:312 start_codon:yes stop_codon:yes gene_type:complete